MARYCFAVTLWTAAAIALLARGVAVAAEESCIAVFDFELIDHSHEGELRGAKADEQQRLDLLSMQLRDWIVKSGRKSCDMAPVAAEAHASNLSACGCVPRLAQNVGGGLAVVGSVHKLSNLILNVRVDVFDATTNRLLIQQNADIRSNTDASWKRGLDWLIKHRLSGSMAALGAEP
jgi:hypothetical protein